MKESEKLDDFCMRLNGLVTNLRALGETMEESYVVKKLLRAIPSRFWQIASTIEQFGNVEKMSIEETIGSLKAHEERLGGQSNNTDGQLLLTEEEWAKREVRAEKLLLTRDEWLKKMGKGSSSDGFMKDNIRKVRDRSRVRCFNCQLLGHFASECRRAKKEKEQKSEVNLTQIHDDEPALLMAKCEESKSNMVQLNQTGVIQRLSMSNKEREESVWYLDNGASNHMTGEKEKFKELDEGVTGQVRFGDGSTVDIKGKGTICLRYKNGEERLLKDVYFIPTLCNNIISLGQLSEDGNRVVISGEYLWVYDAHGKLLMKVQKS
ncbi:hypothetical protein AgCh_016698 [Apium graveolens]